MEYINLQHDVTFTYCSVLVRPQLNYYVLFWTLLIKNMDHVYRIQKKYLAIRRNLKNMTEEKLKYFRSPFPKLSLCSKNCVNWIKYWDTSSFL